MKEKVVILQCDSYDRSLISTVVQKGIKILGFEASGNVFLKPNVVFARKDKKRWGETAYTNPDFTVAVMEALSQLDVSKKIQRVDIGEKGGIGFPTRVNYRLAGYYDIRPKVDFPYSIFCIEEDKRKTVHLAGKVHPYLRLSRRLVNADTVIYVPRVKGHGLTGMTCAMKLGIGILYDDERACRHDYAIYEKIVDTVQAVRAVTSNHLIVADVIDVGIGMEMGAKSRHLGAVIMGTNHLAVDLVAGYLYNLRPPEEKVGYLKAAIARGFGPRSLEEIDIISDFPHDKGMESLDLLADRLKPHDDDFFWWCNTEKNLQRVSSKIKWHHGPSSTDPEIWCESCDMCFRIAMGAIEMHGGVECFSRGKDLVVINGIHEEIDCRGRNVLFLGRCTKVGRLLNPGKVKKINKCFVTVRDLVIDLQRLGLQNVNLAKLAGLPNPAFEDKKFLARAIRAYLKSILIKIFNGYYLSEIGNFLKYKFDKTI